MSFKHFKTVPLLSDENSLTGKNKKAPVFERYENQNEVQRLIEKGVENINEAEYDYIMKYWSL
jgi:hypothetical protein